VYSKELSNMFSCIHTCLQAQQARVQLKLKDLRTCMRAWHGKDGHMYACMYVCIYIYICTHTYIHTRISNLSHMHASAA
jgi:hypothetical protein